MSFVNPFTPNVLKNTILFYNTNNTNEHFSMTLTLQRDNLTVIQLQTNEYDLTWVTGTEGISEPSEREPYNEDYLVIRDEESGIEFDLKKYLPQAINVPEGRRPVNGSRMTSKLVRHSNSELITFENVDFKEPLLDISNYTSLFEFRPWNNFRDDHDVTCLPAESEMSIFSYRNPLTGNTVNNYKFIPGDQYSAYRKFALYNGFYLIKNIPDNHPITILNSSKEEKIKCFGLEGRSKKYSKSVTYQENSQSITQEYDFYSGDLIIEVLDDFGEVEFTVFTMVE